MSAIIALLIQFLPTLLKLLGLLFGASAGVSHGMLEAGGEPLAMTSGTYLGYVGGNGAAAVLSMFGGIWLQSINARRAAREVDWGETISGLKGVNVTSLIQLAARVFQLVSGDAEASRLIKEVFGISTTSTIPLSQDEVVKAIIGRLGK